ncbi:MAG: FKBP-type peptidyl-prolyl cis-trans isomerase [Sphingobacterium sp.]|jgi:FKBP-type peptidyl-prolyl cis-trans isomerase FkpA|nr:FKBP-type peptidyl-prolyl cis-trans isomerase [Sphingobacterium sp.]
MKKWLLYIVLPLSITFSIIACNNKNDFDFEAALKEQARRDSIEKVRIDDLIKKQASDLKIFANEKIPGATLVDSLGIWFIVDAPGDDASYDYKLHPSGRGILAPFVKVSYKGTLLDGTVFDEKDVEKAASFNLSNVIRAWKFALLPKEVRINAQTIPLNGLTAKGLKKGAKIRFVTSSPWGYDAIGNSNGTVKIPADAPLYFEINVIDISDKDF